MAGSPQILYPHLRGDLDANPQLLAALDKLAARLGKVFNVTSGRRTDAEQVQLYNHPQGYPVAKPRSLGGSGSNHESGDAADVLVNGQPIQNAIAAATLRAAGLEPLAGDAVHVQLPGASRGGDDGPNIGGAIVNGLQAAPVIGPVIGAGIAAGDAATSAATDVAGAAAKATAQAIVGLLVDAIGTDGTRVLVSVALAGGALVLIGVGAARAAGVKASSLPIPLPPPAAALAAAIK